MGILDWLLVGVIVTVAFGHRRWALRGPIDLPSVWQVMKAYRISACSINILFLFIGFLACFGYLAWSAKVDFDYLLIFPVLICLYILVRFLNGALFVSYINRALSEWSCEQLLQADEMLRSRMRRHLLAWLPFHILLFRLRGRNYREIQRRLGKVRTCGDDASADRVPAPVRIHLQSLVLVVFGIGGLLGLNIAGSVRVVREDRHEIVVRDYGFPFRLGSEVERVRFSASGKLVDIPRGDPSWEPWGLTLRLLDISGVRVDWIYIVLDVLVGLAFAGFILVGSEMIIHRTFGRASCRPIKENSSVRTIESPHRDTEPNPPDLKGSSESSASKKDE